MAWIDYRKAYDSVPYEWILKTLQTYRLNKKTNQVHGSLNEQLENYNETILQ